MLEGASSVEGIHLSDDMIRSYICTAHLRVIRQLNCTIRGNALYFKVTSTTIILALRESTRAVVKHSDTIENGTTSPIPESEETHKYVENVMTKSNRSDIFSQVPCVIFQTLTKSITYYKRDLKIKLKLNTRDIRLK